MQSVNVSATQPTPLVEATVQPQNAVQAPAQRVPQGATNNTW